MVRTPYGPVLPAPLSIAYVSIVSPERYWCSYEANILPCNNWRMADRIFMKFGADVMPLEVSPYLVFLKFIRLAIKTWQIKFVSSEEDHH
jgi:hypothetical protein